MQVSVYIGHATPAHRQIRAVLDAEVIDCRAAADRAPGQVVVRRVRRGVRLGTAPRLALNHGSTLPVI